MDVELVKEKLVQALENPGNDIKYQEFINVYVTLLDEVKVNVDTANIAVEAVKLDKGVNFLDSFAALDKKQVPDAWKATCGCKGFKENIDYGALRLMCSFAVSALGGDISTSLITSILTAIVKSVKLPKHKTINVTAYEVVREYLLEMLMKDVKLPEWNNINMTEGNVLVFCDIIEKALKIKPVMESGSSVPAAFNLKKWINAGKQYAEETKLVKNNKKNKLPKKSTELLALAKHYKSLEDELDKSMYEAAKLTLRVNSLQEELNESEASGRIKEQKIRELQKKIEELETKVSQAKQEVDERKRLNDAQVQYREDSQASMLQDIARTLKPQYGDYEETRDAPMSEMLGEIYREKLKQVFKILEQKGIKVSD